jgi:hypothetical protein
MSIRESRRVVTQADFDRLKSRLAELPEPPPEERRLQRPEVAQFVAEQIVAQLVRGYSYKTIAAVLREAGLNPNDRLVRARVSELLHPGRRPRRVKASSAARPTSAVSLDA